MFKRHTGWLTSGFVSLMILLFISGMAIYNNYAYNKMLDAYYISLHELSEQTIFNIESKLSYDLSSLETLGNSIAVSNNVNDITDSTLQRVNERTFFDHIVISDVNGVSRYANGRISNISNRDYWADAISGKSLVAGPIMSKIEDAEIIVLAAPIRFEGEIVGVITGSYRVEALNKLFLPSFDGQGYGSLVDSKGQILAQQENPFSFNANSNIFSFVTADSVFKGDSPTVVQEKLNSQSGKTTVHGTVWYERNGEKFITHYGRADVKDWTVAITIPDALATSYAYSFVSFTAALSLVFIILMTIMVFMVFKTQRVHLCEIEEHNKVLTELSNTDFLTKIYNRLALEHYLEHIICDLPHPHLPINLLLFDIDYFKKFNDTYGHPAGDTALIAVANAIKAVTEPEGGIVARVGGEEFCVMLQGKSSEQISEFAEKILFAVRNLSIPLEGKVTENVTISIGSYQYVGEDKSYRDLYVKADKALYAAKQQGRNRHVAYESLPEEA